MLILRYCMPPPPREQMHKSAAYRATTRLHESKQTLHCFQQYVLAHYIPFFSVPASRPGNGFHLLFVLPKTESAACFAKPVALLASKAATRSSGAKILSSRQHLIQNVISPSQCLIQHVLSPLPCWHHSNSQFQSLIQLNKLAFDLSDLMLSWHKILRCSK